MTLWIAAVLGLVEGLTEFLPVSSTGHLILVGALLGIGENDERAKTFEIVVQLGAILAVCWEYRRDLTSLAARAPRERKAAAFLAKLFLAFLPAAIVGLLFGKAIKERLFNPTSVAIALVVGGVAMILMERLAPKRTPGHVEDITWGQALGVGLFQLTALWPGVSRSAATILGGLALGLDRSRATVFSFYLALPTLGAATVYEAWKSRHLLSSADAAPFAVGLAVAFVSALLVIRGMLAYVRRYDFVPLAVYRILLGLIVFVLLRDRM